MRKSRLVGVGPRDHREVELFSIAVLPCANERCCAHLLVLVRTNRPPARWRRITWSPSLFLITVAGITLFLAMVALSRLALGTLMRKRLLKLFEDHGEAEVYAPRNAGDAIAAMAAK